MNGTTVVIPLAIPLALCVAIFFLLRRVCTTGSDTAGTVATVLAGVMVAFAVITGFSIGMFVLPAAAAALAAATIVPSPR